MSFYGQVIYELTNAFSDIVIRNSGKSNSNFNTNIQTETNVPAAGLENKFYLDSGNKWVSLEGNPNSYTCKIYHSQLDNKDKSNTINTFSTIEEDAGAKQLEPGQYFTIDKIHYDNAGHVTSSEPVSYQLPITDIEADISELNSRVETLETDNTDNKTNIGTAQSDIANLKEGLDIANSEIVRVEETITEDLSDLSKLVGPRMNFSLDSSDNLTKAFGNYNDFKAATGNATSIAQAFINQQSIIDANLLAVKAVTKNLCDALAKDNIIIDSDSLWKNT